MQHDQSFMYKDCNFKKKKKYIHLPQKSNRSKMLMLGKCQFQTQYNIFSKVQQPNGKLRLVMWLVTVSERKIQVTLVGLSQASTTSCIFFFHKECYIKFICSHPLVFGKRKSNVIYSVPPYNSKKKYLNPFLKLQYICNSYVIK